MTNDIYNTLSGLGMLIRFIDLPAQPAKLCGTTFYANLIGFLGTRKGHRADANMDTEVPV